MFFIAYPDAHREEVRMVGITGRRNFGQIRLSVCIKIDPTLLFILQEIEDRMEYKYEEQQVVQNGSLGIQSHLDNNII